jgi:N-acyl-D-amino-acid deacylase
MIRKMSILAAMCATSLSQGAEPPASSELKKAAERGLALVQKAAANYPKHRDCFSCHHQTLPMLAMVTARDHGLAIDDTLLKQQSEFTLDTFKTKTTEMKQGRGIGGRGMTVGYALWALAVAEAKPDATTEAMVAYLLKIQREEGHWTGQMCRPPLEESYFTATLLAVRGMKRCGNDEQKKKVDSAMTKAKSYIAAAPAKSQEDKAMRLWALHELGANAGELKSARAAVLKAQRSDGGWAQLDEMDSDAYATGQTLFVLQATGFGTSEAAYQRGVQFLLKTQKPDGSWLVVSRSKPIQTDFDNGDPHGKNQFISTPATAWATAALAAALPHGKIEIPTQKFQGTSNHQQPKSKT